MNTCLEKQSDGIWKFPGYEVGSEIDWEGLCKKYSWLEDMKRVQQDSEWHAEGDVFTHTKMVVAELLDCPRFPEFDEQTQHILFAAALMHDIEKRSTTVTEVRDGKERVVSPKHALKGEKTVRGILYTQMGCPFEVREKVARLIRFHGLPFWVIETEDSVKRVIGASLEVDTELLYYLAKADARGRVAEDKEETLLKIDLYRELCIEHECYGVPREFKSELARFEYLNNEEEVPMYEPYDDYEFEVTVMCAVPGSGKDTYIKNNLGLPMLSLDDIRRKNKVKRGDKKAQGRMMQEAKEAAKVFMREKRSFVFNATNITKDIRQKWISLFFEYRAKVKIVYLEASYKNLKHQNKNREFPVSDEVLEDYIATLEMPTHSEAHKLEFVICY